MYNLCVFSLSGAAAHSNMLIYVIISCIIGDNFSGRKVTLFISQQNPIDFLLGMEKCLQNPTIDHSSCLA